MRWSNRCPKLLVLILFLLAGSRFNTPTSSANSAVPQGAKADQQREEFFETCIRPPTHSELLRLPWRRATACVWIGAKLC